MIRRKWKQKGAFALALSMVLSGFSTSGLAYATQSDEAVPVESNAAEEASVYRASESKAVSGLSYLSDMSMKSSSAGWGSWHFDEDIDEGVAIELYMGEEDGVKTFEKGLSVNSGNNSASRATYDVSNYGGQTFFAFTGVHYSQLSAENSGRGATVKFEVRIDGQSVWQSDGIRKPSSPAEMVMIDLPEGASELTLYVDGAGDGINYDHGIWAKACLIEDTSVLKTLESIYADAPGYFEVGQSSPMTLKGKAFDESNVAFDDSVTVTCESSDDGILSVRGAKDQWTLTGNGDGAASVQVTVEKGDVTLNLEKSILVGNGEEGSIVTASPNGDHNILFALSPEGELSYYIFTNASGRKNMVVEGAATGLRTNLGDFSTGLTLVESETHTVTDSYDLLGAKEDHVDVTGNETIMKFEKQPNDNGVYYYIIARAYDDGVAFRYQISADTKQELLISWENTTIKLPSDAHSFATPFNNHNESMEVEKDNSGLSGAFCMPHLYKTGDTYCLLSEAAISQEYAGAALYGDGTGTMEIRVSEGDNRPTDVVQTTTSVQDPWAKEGEEHPWVSPWRLLVMGDLNTIHGTTMPETLSPDCVVEDTSWIVPGTCSWTWLNGEGTRSFDTYKRYVDMTAEMGWKYLLLDEGWQPNAPSGSGYRYKGYYDWFPDLVEYADEKGVGLIAWAYYTDLETPERQKVLEEWAAMGIKGIKPDFFDSNSQEFMEFFLQLYQKTAECHLLMNAHGAPKTTGERRTFPHLLTREGIYGAEMGGGPTAHHTCATPFTRNAVGPADYTPLLSIYRSGQAYRNYTTGHNSALPIIMESGITCMADRDVVYLNSVTRPLYYELPSEWIGSKVLEGDVGQYATIMRESNDGRYYIGTICNKERTTDISLDFLPDTDTYHAYIVEDGEQEDELTMRHQTVTKSDRLALPLQKTGGALVLIMKNTLTKPETLTLDQHELEMTNGKDAQLTATLSPANTQISAVTWKSSDESVVTVSQGKLVAKKCGIATVTAECAGLTDSCKIKVYPGEFDKSEQWDIVREVPSKWKLNHETSLTLTSADNGNLLRDRDATKNEFFIDPERDFEVSVKLTFQPHSNYQSAGLLAMGDNGAYTSLWRRYHTYFSGNLLNMVTWKYNSYDEGDVNEGSNTDGGRKPETAAQVQKSVWLKMVKDGNNITSYYHYEGEDWTLMKTEANPRLNQAGVIRVGVYLGDDQSGANVLQATFEDFTYKAKDGEETVIPFGQKPEIASMAMEMLQKGKTDYQYGEAFDASGYRFNVYYTDKTEREITGDDCEVTGFSSHKSGPQTVTFTYEGQSFEVTANVEANQTDGLLEIVYEAYVDLDVSAYTEDSANAFTKALEDASLVLNGESEMSEGEAVSKLMGAAAGLIINTSGLSTDIDAAKKAAQAAQQAADAAQKVADAAAKAKDLETLRSAVTAAQTAASEANRVANEALKAAGENADAIEVVRTAAQTAQSAANTAQIAADAAQRTADEAQKAADEAQKAADEALKEAESSKEAIEEAQRIADAALKEAALNKTAAEEAQKAANAAQQAADTALELVKTTEKQLDDALKQNAADKEDLRKLEEELKAIKEAAERAKEAAKQAEAQINAANQEAESAKQEAKEMQLMVQKIQFKSAGLTLKSVKSDKKQQIKAAWKKVTGADGYEVRYATNSKFKKANKVVVKKGTTLKATMKKLKSGKKYFVKVRAYKKIGGAKVYTKYSKVKKAQVK